MTIWVLKINNYFLCFCFSVVRLTDCKDLGYKIKEVIGVRKEAISYKAGH